MLEPCDLHEITNCATCTGADKKFEASLQDPWVDSGPPPRIPGGVTISARYHGTCANCGRRYQAGEAIHRSPETDGWVGVSCCVNFGGKHV